MKLLCDSFNSLCTITDGIMKNVVLGMVCGKGRLKKIKKKKGKKGIREMTDEDEED